MSYTISFIDKTILTDRTDLGTNYSGDNVRNAILNAQQFDLFPIIGKNLYERFDRDIDTDSYGDSAYQTDHPAYYELMEDYIVPYLTWASYSRVLDSSYISPRDNGLGQRNGEGTTAVTNAQYSLKKTQAEEKISYFAQKLVEYLSYNISDFDELNDQTDLVTDRPKFSNAIEKIAYFGRGSKRKYNGYNTNW